MEITDSRLDALLGEKGETQVFSRREERVLLIEEYSRRSAVTKRRRLILSVSAVIASVCLVVPGAAFATHKLSTQTGIFEESNPAAAPAEDEAGPWTRLSVPGSEWLEGTAPDFLERVHQLAPDDLPIPENTSWEEISNSVAKRMSTLVTSANEGGSGETNGVWVQDFTIKMDYEQVLLMAWIDEWNLAYKASASLRMQEAAEVLHASLEWPSFATETGGSRDVIAQARRIWIDRIVQGEPEAAQALAEIEQTDTWDSVSRTDLIREVDLQAWAEVGQ